MTTETRVISDEILQKCAERAPSYDQENRFFTEDFEDLKRAGYLLMPIPKELGGLGMTLAQVCREQRRLGYHAAPTALAVNMHLYWMGVAAELWNAGDKSLEWLLREGAAGEVYAAGHAETGNDIPGLLSTTKAERVDGGYRFTGRKSFGSLTPVWTRLGIHGMDTSDPNVPKVVHAFMPRNTPGATVINTWDTVGMRASQSQDTLLEGAFVPDKYIGRVVAAGGKGIDLFVLSIFAWALMGFANIYYGLARRALDIAIANLKSRSALAVSRTMAYHPEMQHGIANMVIELEGIEPHIEKIAEDWSNHVDYGHEWGLKLVAAKYHAVEGAWRVVDKAMDISGGYGIFRRSGLERLWRDARLGRFHPANAALTHEIVGKTALGIDLDEQPRWG